VVLGEAPAIGRDLVEGQTPTTVAVSPTIVTEIVVTSPARSRSSEFVDQLEEHQGGA